MAEIWRAAFEKYLSIYLQNTNPKFAFYQRIVYKDKTGQRSCKC